MAMNKFTSLLQTIPEGDGEKKAQPAGAKPGSAGLNVPASVPNRAVNKSPQPGASLQAPGVPDRGQNRSPQPAAVPDRAPSKSPQPGARK